jgi:hypothetical protein
MRIVLLCCVAALVAPAAGSGASAQRGVFVGRVQGSRAFVALVSNGRRLGGGYVCDGRKVAIWLRRRPLRNRRAALVTRKGTKLGRATFARSGAAGTVFVDGFPHRFRAVRAIGKAGLYRLQRGRLGKRASRESGWIVLPNGSRRGATNLVRRRSVLVVKPAPVLSRRARRVTSSFTDPLRV